MRNKGRYQCRFQDNPMEEAFAEEWEKANSSDKARGVLDYMMADDVNNPRGEVTERDREVAATVIQWLGSTIGMAFVTTVWGHRYGMDRR